MLSTKNLTCLRGNRLIFEGVTLALEPGDGLLLTGPNGSGKSSLLRVLAGLLEPFDGALFINGRNPYEDRSITRDKVVYIGHSDPIKRTLTVQESMMFWAGLSEAAAKKRAQIPEILERLNIAHLANAMGGVLSSGQKRRVSLARLMMSGASLWLIDEPTVGLDINSVTRIEDIVSQHRATGGAVILSTHVAFSLPGGKTLDMGDFAPDWGRDIPLAAAEISK